MKYERCLIIIKKLLTIYTPVNIAIPICNETKPMKYDIISLTIFVFYS